MCHLRRSIMKHSLFKNHSFLFLISAQTVSNLGDWLHLVALFALVAFKWHADPIAMAGITLCMVLPSILFGSPAGWLADRFNRKVLMSFSDFARCGCVLGIAFSVSLWQVYIFLFFWAFSQPSSPLQKAACFAKLLVKTKYRRQSAQAR